MNGKIILTVVAVVAVLLLIVFLLETVNPDAPASNGEPVESIGELQPETPEASQ